MKPRSGWRPRRSPASSTAPPNRASWVLVLLLAAVPLPSLAQNFAVSEESLVEAPFLAEKWRYAPVRSLAEATRVGPPTGSIQTYEALSSPQLRAGSTPTDWSGAGWFVIDLEVRPELVEVPLGLSMPRHYGASRIYIDGRLIDAAGALSLDSKSIQPTTRPDPILFELTEPGAHRLAVLFANPDVERYHRVGYPAGFSARLEPAAGAVARARISQRGSAHRRALFTSLFLAFALLHLLFYLFRPEGGANLSFAIFCCALAALIFLLEHKQLVDDPRIVFWSEGAMNLAGLVFAVAGVLFVHQVFSRRLPRPLFWVFVGLALASPWFALRPAASVTSVFVIMFLALLEMARCVVLAVRQRRPGARIVGLGVLALAVGFGLGLLANLGILPPVRALTTIVPFYSMPVLILAMSISLSRRYARTHNELEEQLERVRVLSEQRLEQERRERKRELQTKLLEAEVARKADELEEARQLQISMLPQTIPEHPRFEIAAHMTTATEVGGDYYDFAVSKDGALTVAVGDATGHGLRAGTMVTATKSLFNALGEGDDVVEVANRSNRALKRMNLRNLNMAMLLARFDGSRLVVVSAGMPQPLVYRAADDRVESLEIGGMPLGAMAGFPYQAAETELASGDVVLLMSDGFPERLNAAGAELGYDAAARAFHEAVGESPQDVVSSLVQSELAWADGTDADDDVTFVALGVR